MSGKPIEFEVDVIQYLMPNGRRRHCKTDLPVDVKPAYEDMQQHNCRFESEMLTTGEVSLTIYDPDSESDIDIEVVKNGPDIQTAMARMLKRGLWQGQNSHGIHI